MQQINIEDYNYPLLNEKIAAHPLENRDESKILMLKNAVIAESIFKSIDSYLPNGSTLVFNNTKVIQARLLFKKETGARIEIFCLEPYGYSDYQLAFQEKKSVKWKCLVGNAKKWKEGKLFKKIHCNDARVDLSVEVLERQDDAFIVEFSWSPEGFSFSEILENSGNTPLPPYIKREAEENDKTRYQTIYAEHKGSVAAPTAGLHFTENVFEKLAAKNIEKAYVSLHVGAGTFKPVSTSDVSEHEMHTERIVVERHAIEKLKKSNYIIPVGTTSVRTIESIYWFGVKLINGEEFKKEMQVYQWDPYQKRKNQQITKEASMDAVLKWLDNNKMDVLQGATQLMIVPGYKFKFVNALITNFHQPKSTLLLLVSALIGEKWKEVYDYALKNDFRFLSYGDSCLFFNESK